jgi:hypothetical protein
VHVPLSVSEHDAFTDYYSGHSVSNYGRNQTQAQTQYRARNEQHSLSRLQERANELQQHQGPENMQAKVHETSSPFSSHQYGSVSNPFSDSDSESDRTLEWRMSYRKEVEVELKSMAKATAKAAAIGNDGEADSADEGYELSEIRGDRRYRFIRFTIPIYLRLDRIGRLYFFFKFKNLLFDMIDTN